VSASSTAASRQPRPDGDMDGVASTSLVTALKEVLA